MRIKYNSHKEIHIYITVVVTRRVHSIYTCISSIFFCAFFSAYINQEYGWGSIFLLRRWGKWEKKMADFRNHRYITVLSHNIHISYFLKNVISGFINILYTEKHITWNNIQCYAHHVYKTVYKVQLWHHL